MLLPPYEVFPAISDDRILLREILPGDIESLIPISYYDGIPATTLEEAAAMQARICADYQRGETIHWGIEDLQTGAIVGTCGYYRSFTNGAGELGCVLLPLYRGQGFMTPALALAIDYGRRSIGLSRIWAETRADNAAAIRLLYRLGFHATGPRDGSAIIFEVSDAN